MMENKAMENSRVIRYVPIPEGVDFVRVGRFFLKIQYDPAKDAVIINDDITIRDGGRR